MNVSTPCRASNRTSCYMRTMFRQRTAMWHIGQNKHQPVMCQCCVCLKKKKSHACNVLVFFSCGASKVQHAHLVLMCTCTLNVSAVHHWTWYTLPVAYFETIEKCDDNKQIAYSQIPGSWYSMLYRIHFMGLIRGSSPCVEQRTYLLHTIMCVQKRKRMSE